MFVYSSSNFSHKIEHLDTCIIHTSYMLQGCSHYKVGLMLNKCPEKLFRRHSFLQSMHTTPPGNIYRYLTENSVVYFYDIAYLFSSVFFEDTLKVVFVYGVGHLWKF